MTTSLEEWERDLAGSARTILQDLIPTVKKAAVNVKKDWTERIKSVEGGSVRRAHYTIAFDEPVVWAGKNVIDVEVSPHERYRGTGKQRGVAIVLEFGTADTPAYLFGQRSLDAEADNFTTWVAKAAADSMLGEHT